MRVLIIGGTGLISSGIVKQLLARDPRIDITLFTRGQRTNLFADRVKTIHGDRNDFDAFEQTFRDKRFDVVIDMMCFRPDQAQSCVRAFSGRCGQFIFCSTVCIYGVKSPPEVFIDESFPPEPITGYGRDKLECERIFLRAHERNELPTTIIRPSNTYGPGGALIDNLEPNPTSWDRIDRGLPVLCAGDGFGLWIATHRDDVGKMFAHSATNPKTFGQAYNATRDDAFTWRDLIRQTAAAMGKTAKVIFMPAAWIVAQDPARFRLLHDITQYHGVYSSAKAKRDVPEFRCEIDYATGAAETIADLRRRNAWRNSADDARYDDMVKKALEAGVAPIAV